MTDLTPHQPTLAELSQIADDWAEERTDPGYRGWHVPGWPDGNGPLPASEPLRAIRALTDPAVAPQLRTGFDWNTWNGDDN